MGGYYVPNIQRPGFGYQRRTEDDDDEDQFGGANDWGGGGDAAAPAPAASAAGGYSPLAPSMSYGQSGQPDSSGSPSRGGAGTTPTNTEMNLLPEPPVPQTNTIPEPPAPQMNIIGEPPVPRDAEIPTARPDIPGVGLPPTARPSRVPPPVSSHAEEEKLKQMLKQGPKRSILGTIAAAATGFGVGYTNAAGRARPIPVPTQAMRDMTWRAPGGGAWDTKIARQRQLAEQEQGEEKRSLAAQQVEAQAEERRAQADYYKQHGTYLEQTAKTAAKTEEDRQQQQALQRIIAMGGKTPQIRYFPANSVPDDVAKSNDWYIRTDPADPSHKIAVRPDPGQQIDDETADFLGLPKGAYVQTRDAVGAARAKVALATAGETSTNKENQLLRQQLADEERKRHNKETEKLGAGREADQAEARQARLDADKEKRDAGINSARDTKLTSATVWRQNELDKIRTQGSINPEADEAKLDREWLRRSQSAYDEWGQAIRRGGGSAADFTVYPNGSVAQSTEAYRAGGKGVPLGEAPAPALTPAPKPKPTGGKVPPPVNAASQAKTMTSADLQAYAKEHTHGDVAAAKKLFIDKGWTILF